MTLLAENYKHSLPLDCYCHRCCCCCCCCCFCPRCYPHFPSGLGEDHRQDNRHDRCVLFYEKSLSHYFLPYRHDCHTHDDNKQKEKSFTTETLHEHPLPVGEAKLDNYCSPFLFFHSSDDKLRSRPKTRVKVPTTKAFSFLFILLTILSNDLLSKNQLNLNIFYLQPINCQQVSRASSQQKVQPISPNSSQRSQSASSLEPSTFQGGTIKDRNVTLVKQFNPILITKDIIIKKDAKLTIESGTELLFDSRKGIVVHGTLEILGSRNDRVKLGLLRSQQSPTINFRSQNNHPNGPQQVRLVDGEFPNEGRVQIKFNDRWHSLCTNAKNLTAADIKILCKQVGFKEGSFAKWFPQRNNTIPQLMIKTLQCTGDEMTVQQCKRWSRIRAGGGICDSQSDIGIRCSRKLAFSSPDSASYDYWKGIEFVNSETSNEYVLGGQMRQKVSKSRLNNVLMTEAGLNDVGNATAAIKVTGQPPTMHEIEIKNSIYGIFMEEVEDSVQLSDIKLVNNLASSLFINTSWGKVSLDRFHVEGNGGDGIRIVRHEKILTGSHDFCKFANLGPAQTFPVILSHEQTFFTAGRDCCQEFLSDNQLTVHFQVLRSTPNNLLPEGDNNRRVSIPPGVNIGKDAHLVIYDDYRDEFPFKLKVQNHTRANSIVSRAGRLKICYEPAHYRTVLFTIEVVADYEDGEGTGRARDVEIRNSFIKGNEGRGIWIENPRSGVKLLNTSILNHNYLSGLHVENGTGEVIIQASTISNNTGHGVYINLAGGYYHIDNSTISDNTLKGILLEYDKRHDLVPFNHTFHLGYSLIARNGENGLFIGNVCRSDAFWNISMNSFIENGEDAINFQSCLPKPEVAMNFRNLTSRLNMSDPEMKFFNNFQDLLITHNVFLANVRRAINMAPVFFVKTFIRHNMFKRHQLAVLHISNKVLPDVEPDALLLAPVSIRIASNRFYNNNGRYVANIGVQEDNPRHFIHFTKNTLEENHITEPYSDLRPRSRVSAVVAVSSSNTRVIRNRFNNPQSNFELGSHLEMHSKIINATTNFWGSGLDAASIYKRIFDRKNRYNLAQVEFLQYLIEPEDLEYATHLSFDQEQDKISVFKNGTKIGGEVKGYEELRADVYTVEDDIFIRPGGHLILKPGTVLKFYDGVGLMVQGRLDALGQSSSQITFTSVSAGSRALQRQAPMITTPSPTAYPWISHLPESNQEDESATNFSSKFSPYSNSIFRRSSTLQKRQINSLPSQVSQNVRLSHTTMGRLEVQIDGNWGPVCDYNFDINDAAVVCQQLGMILNKDDWLLERFQYAANDQQQISMLSTDASMSNIRCDPSLDTDITKCKAELSSRGDFDGMCNSVVGMRCFPPSWSGIRLGMGAEISTLEHVAIQRAGMFDYALYTLKPALQIDFNRHLLSSITTKSNSDSGMGILWNDVIGRHPSDLSIADSKFLNNERHGIELRSRGISFKNCLISNNRQSGLDYNPTFSQNELNDLLSWLYTSKNSENIISIPSPIQDGSRYFSVPSSEDSFKFFVLQKNPLPNTKETFTIGTDPGHMLSIHLLNPIHPHSTESLNMSIGTNFESPIWDLRLNMTSFPMVSPGYKFHFSYHTGPKPRGNIILYIRSRYNNRDLKLLAKHIPPHLVMPKFEQTAVNINTKLINSLTVKGSNITKNGIGLKFRHPNYSFGPLESYNRRYANESTNITDNLFDNNYFSSIFIGSDDYEWHTDLANKSTAASEIYYYVSGNKIRRNKDGIRQFSRDLRQSNNVFHWSITNSSFEQNRGGGINIVLPYYWPYDANLSHTMEFNNNSFIKNSNFEFIVDGHFAVVNITSNNFRENRCRVGLMSLVGMEKKALVRFNSIENNICSRIIDFNIQSHADKMGYVTAQLEYNSLRYNRKPLNVIANVSTPSASKHPGLASRLHPRTSDYALSLRGVQAVNISRNLFVNPELRYELVVAIIMDPEEKTVRATENYWGSTIHSEISSRIFDFDDWNCYAVAEISPCLTQDSFNSAIVASESRDLPKTGKQALGGRLTKSLNLPYRKEPYLVESDLTVMPNVKLTIEKGVTLEFMPSVGILVLGDLIAAGTRERPIHMKQALTASEVLPYQQILFPPKMKPTLTLPNINDPSTYEHNYALRHYQLAYPIDLGSIRLCKNEICNDGSHLYENNVEDPILRQEVLKSSNNSWKIDGFLEIYNMTTLQWVPVCDPLFTEHTARVVCRQLGYSHLSIFKRGRRYTIEQEQITSIKNWPESLQCEGDESDLVSCPLAPDGFTNHSTACTKEGNQFIYVHCSDFPEVTSPSGGQLAVHGTTSEHAHHWGGIRFSCHSFSSPMGPPDINRQSMINAASGQVHSGSRIQYVTIDRAGMLHRKKAPAVQVLQCAVKIEYVAVTNSAHHGIEIITSLGNQNFHQLRIKNNLGIGFNYVSLTGSSSASRLVPYLPLKHLDISSDIFGLVDICGANKEITIEERLLIFYRYNSISAECVKIITSKFRIKHIGIRLLQFDLFNSTAYTGRPDSLRIYDGNIFDRDSRLLVDLGVSERHRIEKPELKFYQSTDSTMTIRLHASGAGPMYGFIAEVVTTPVSYNIQRDTYNNITFSEITSNKLGALTISSAGESSPNLIVKDNRFESNCMHLFGNFTSCTSSVYMEIQNCQRMRISRNLFKGNQGGLMTKSYSHSAVSALEAVIDNNVFESNHNTYTLALLGPKSDPYQTVLVTRNLFTRNYAQYLSNIVLSRIVANFSVNILSGNIGRHQIEVVGFDKLPLSYQTFSGNWIYNNTATDERDRSTVFGNSAGQQYFMNYLVNPDNHFELSTMNWSRYDVKPLQIPRDDEIIHLAAGDGSTKDLIRKTVDSIPINIIDSKKINLYHAAINAKQNWWGFDSSVAIQGRIRDRIQHEELIKVDFLPYLETNRSVLSGVCAGGWRNVGSSCLFYVGARMTYQEAKEFCDHERATLPILHGIGHFSLGNHYDLVEFVKSQNYDYDPRIDRIWVRSFDVGRELCPALNDHLTKSYDCQERHSFICEKDTLIAVRLMHWYRETGGLIAFLLALITMILTACCTICWAYKSRQRYKEKLRRKSSIYASMRANHMGPHSSSNSLSELFLHRQIYNPEKSSITDLSLSTQMTPPGSDHSTNLIRLDPAYKLSGSEKKSDLNHITKSKSRSSINSLNNDQMNVAPTYANARTSEALFELQPSLNTSYVKPPSSMGSRQDVPAFITNLSYHPDAYSIPSNISGSRTSSYASSHNSVVGPFSPPASTIQVPNIISLAPTYTQIDHTRTIALNDPRSQLQATSTATIVYEPQSHGSSRDLQRDLSYSDAAPGDEELVRKHRNLDGQQNEIKSPDRNFYNNQFDTTFEESTQSYLEAYHNAYNETLERLQNDQLSYIITEHSSLTDTMIDTNQKIRTSIVDVRTGQPDAHLMSQENPFTQEEYETRDVQDYRETTELASVYETEARGLVETSFEYDDPTGAGQTSQNIYDAESQVPRPYAKHDARLEPRVYLETSFECD